MAHRPDGSLHEVRESSGTSDAEKAQALLDLRVRQVRNHEDGIRPFSGSLSLTVGDLLDDLKRRYRLKGIKSMVQTLNHLEMTRRFFGKMRVSDVRGDSIDRYIEREQARGRSNDTVNRRLEVLRRAFRLGVQNGKVPSVPAIERLTPAPPRQGFFERAEVERILAHLPAPNDDVLRFGYLTGWRRGEILPLRWEWVDRIGGEIRLPTSKNGLARCLPMDRSLSEIIERRWTARRYTLPTGEAALSPFVFHRGGKMLDDRPFEKVWKRACKAAGLPGRLFHDLRRTAARDLLRAGVPQIVAQRITGHRTASMFTRYAIVEREMQLDAMVRRAAFLEAERAKTVRMARPGAETSDTSSDTPSENPLNTLRK